MIDDDAPPPPRARTPAQALLHAPLLRNHYLLSRHPRLGCAVSADGGHCVNCELVGVPAHCPRV